MHNLVYHVNVLSAAKKFPRKNSEKVFFEDSLIFRNSYTNNKFILKISEAFFIKEERPSVLRPSELPPSFYLVDYKDMPP